MKAVFVCDNNKVYSDFWEPMAKHMWSKFRTKSKLYYLTDEMADTPYESDFAMVQKIQLLPNVPRIIQALMAKWYFPAFEDENIFICDIDCFILSQKFINYVLSSDTLFHLKIYENAKLPGYYVYGKPEDLGNFFKVHNRTFEEFCTDILKADTRELKAHEANEFSKSASPDWKYFCIEERFAYKCSLDYNGIVRNNIPHPTPLINRICRSEKSLYDRFQLNAGEYIDYHAPRPYHEHKSIIEEILRG
jgi:hypothetical protein